MDIIGHSKTIRLLKNILAAPRMPHAFLFYGPRDVGKRTVAVAFLAGVLCPDRKFGGCGKCKVCAERLRLGRSRDFMEVSPNDNGVISVGDARDNILNFLSRKPGISAAKAILIDRAECMTEEAGATLLKTLEEPPGDSVLVLTTDRPGEIAGTIRSRLVPVRFSLVTDGEMAAFPARIRELAAGRPGLAKRLLEDKAFSERIGDLLGRAEAVLDDDPAQKILFAGVLAGDPALLEQCFRYWLDILRRRFETIDRGGRAVAGRNARLILNASLAPKSAGAGMRLLLENALLGLS